MGNINFTLVHCLVELLWNINSKKLEKSDIKDTYLFHQVKTNPQAMYTLVTEVLQKLPVLTQLKLSSIDLGVKTRFEGLTIV